MNISEIKDLRDAAQQFIDLVDKYIPGFEELDEENDEEDDEE